MNRNLPRWHMVSLSMGSMLIALIGFVAGCPFAPVDLCTGVTCDEGETCVNGECVPGEPVASNYVGSAKCGECHSSIYDSFVQTGHPFKLNPVVDAQQPEYPVTELAGPPADIEWDDVSFVIGGFRYKYRVVDSDGYIALGPSAQYNFPSQTFSAYNNDDDHTAPGGTPGPWGDNIGRKPYDCGRCHTTGYDGEAENRLGLEGLVGDWAFAGVQCEECHGSGADHVAAPPNNIIHAIDTETVCGKCHTRSPDGIAASGGFVRHHEQWDEFKRTRHAEVMPDGCMTCHDPHQPLFDADRLAGIEALYAADGADSTLDNLPSAPGIIMECTSCHGGTEVTHAGPDACKTCHMAFTTKTAIATGPNSGDIRSHAWLINTDAGANSFTDSEGNPVTRDDPNVTFAALNDEGLAYITLDFACLRCHSDRDATWAAENAAGIHGG